MDGDELTPWLIRYGYEHGAFPMTTQGDEIEWFQPTRRALFPMSGVHVSASLRKVLRRGEFEITFDQAFEEVMRGCLRPDENWISEEMIRVYTQIHHEGWAHSCEVWSTPGTPSPFSGCIVPANGEGA
ncbi:MAG: leucyl/phenylalanyl-tRNA--protein transferase, partial [Fimbriimonadaceae bacterium]